MTRTVEFYLSDEDLAAFFKNAGFETKLKTVTEYIPAYHHKTEQITTVKLHVVVNGEFKRADKLYGKIMTRRMTTPDPTTIAIANEILNND